MSLRAFARRRRPTRSLGPSAPTALLALVLAVVMVPAATGTSSAQTVAQPARPGAVPALFTPLPDLRLDAAAAVRPTEFTGYRLDQDGLRTALSGSSRTGGAVRVSVPDPTGEPVPFEVWEQSVMEPGLQAAHPEIRTYVGRALDGTGRSVAMTTTPLGFTASVRVPGAGASWYVDPSSRGASDTYLSYYGAAVPADPTGLVERGPVDTARAIAAAPGGVGRAARVAAGQPVTVRTYRMAFVTDPTYAAYFGSANVLAAKTVLLARTNQIYNDDLAIRFLLVDGTDQLNLDTMAKASGTNGPCGANACYPATVYQSDGTANDTPDGCSSDVLTRNEFVLGQIIGADNYDIGHIGLGVNGGGIAGLGVVGGGSKASGCTGLPAPTGDFYAVDYFSHEVGHQMGGNHTFDGDQVNCSATNRNGSIPLINPSTAVEPGSGSTVMGYAGICGQDNLQPHSDPYFSQKSIDEIDAVTTAAPGTVTEVQTVSLAGFDAAGDSFQLTYPGAQPVTLTRSATGYGKLAVADAVRTLTGCAVNDFDYDGGVGTMPSDKGFTVEFAYPSLGGGSDNCTNPQRLGVVGGTGGVTGLVGVQDQGGPGANQGATSASGNSAPSVTAPAAKTIPLRTPFVLTGSAVDKDGDPLTYLWEQDDPGSVQGTSLVSNTKTAGALFRVFGTYADVSDSGALTTPAPGINLATGSPTRSFPDLAQVVSGNTNAETGADPTAPAPPTTATGRSNVPRATVECFSEFLPTTDYGNAGTGGALDFRLTARDDAPEGGGTQFADVTLTLDRSAGPFLVTSRRSAGSPAPRGSAETVTWEVNGTDKATLAPQVKILLSTDGGLSFPTVLASATPNDGSESVTLPQVDTAQARIMVAAVDNYFYDVNDAPFTIGTPTITPTTPGTTPGTTPIPGAVPGTTTGAARATKTRLRLPRRTVTADRRAVVRSAVVSEVASGRTAGRIVVRVDGRKTRVRDVVVGDRRSASRNLRLRRDLSPGRHRVVVVFKPAAGSGYLPSRSRTVRLMVVRRS